MSLSPNNSGVDPRTQLRVLIVDDEPTLRLGFSYALMNKSTEVETVANGHLAVERMAEMTFDLVILDYRMPELDGVGVIELLRGRGDFTPVVLCSAAMNSKAVIRAMRARCVDFLLKPIRPVDLRNVLALVTQPQKEPLHHAMVAARVGDIQRACDILRALPKRNIIETCWLEIFRTLLDPEADSQSFEKLVLSSLGMIAHNSPLLP